MEFFFTYLLHSFFRALNEIFSIKTINCPQTMVLNTRIWTAVSHDFKAHQHVYGVLADAADSQVIPNQKAEPRRMANFTYSANYTIMANC